MWEVDGVGGAYGRSMWEEHVGRCGRSICGMGGVWEVGYAYLSTTSQPSKKL